MASSLLKLESKIIPNAKLIEYSKNNTFYLKTLSTENTLNIHTTLEALYDRILKNPYYTTIDAVDPLGYF